jgi:hypothetical protein
MKHFLSFIVILFWCLSLFAQDGLYEDETGPESLLIYFTGQNMDEAEEAWQYIARLGLPASAGWEYEEEQAILLERLGEWASHRLEQALPLPDLQSFLEAIDEANIRFLYDTENDRIVYDDAGDPLLLKAEGVEGDRMAMEAMLEEKIEELMSLWEAHARVVYQEVLSGFGGGMEGKAGEVLNVTFGEYEQSVRREYERLFRYACNEFLRRRLCDSYSLRKKEEDGTAQEIAARLIEETEIELEEARKTLSGPPEGSDATLAARMTVDMEEWEESFQHAFTKGCERWQEAEENFLLERLRWEQEAGERYADAEAAWDEAFRAFGAARERWAQGMLSIIRTGEDAWNEREVQFRYDYGLVYQDLADAVSGETEKVEQEIAAIGALYRQADDMVRFAVENGEYFGRRRAEKEEEIRVLDGKIGQKNREILWECEIYINAKKARIAELYETIDNLTIPPRTSGSGGVYYDPAANRSRIIMINREIEELEEDIGRLEDTKGRLMTDRDALLEQRNAVQIVCDRHRHDEERWGSLCEEYRIIRAQAEADLAAIVV